MNVLVQLLRATALAAVVTACSSTPEFVLVLTSEPSGAAVEMSRHGKEIVRGSLGVFDGDVQSEAFAQPFRRIGTTPMRYAGPLQETQRGGTLLGFGASEILEYEEAFLKVQKEGYQVAERHVRIQDGEVTLHVDLEPIPESDPPAGAEPDAGAPPPS